MTWVLLGIGVVVAGGILAGGIAALVARNRQRRNRVVPDVPTSAPVAWAGAHTPLARLHRRLRAAVVGVRAVPDPDGALIRARVEVERAALAIDDHLVALDGMAERERAGRMAAATAAVASVEEAAARLVDAASASRSTALPAVEDALERARLLAEARAELEDEDVTTTWPLGPDAATAPETGPTEGTDDPDDEGRAQPSTG